MHKVDHPSAVPAKPAKAAAGTPGYYRDSDVGAGVQGTTVPADWLNMIQDEMENVLGIGIPYGLDKPDLDKADDSQLATLLDAYVTLRIADSSGYPPGFIRGFYRSVPNRATNGSTVVTQDGRCRDELDQFDIVHVGLPFQKDIADDFVVGNGNGGWPSALAAPNTFDWVRFFVISKADGQIDFGWDTAAGADNLLADATDFVYYRQIGWDRVLFGDLIRSFYQYPGRPDYVEWAEPVQTVTFQNVHNTWTPAAPGTIPTETPPNTTARMFMLHRFVPGQEGPSQHEWVVRYWPDGAPPNPLTASGQFSGGGGVLTRGLLQQTNEAAASFPVDMWCGSNSEFRAAYEQLPSAGLTVSANALGYFYDRGRDTV